MAPDIATNRCTGMKTGTLALVTLLLVVVTAGCKTGTAGKVVNVAVDPTGVNVAVGMTLQFNATVTDTFNTAVTWAVAGGNGNGTISSTGLYTAPAKIPNPAFVTIIATSLKDSTKRGTAQVTVTTSATPGNVTVQISPQTVSIA